MTDFSTVDTAKSVYDYCSISLEEAKKLGSVNGNRLIDNKHVNQIYKDMVAGFPFPPIMVNRITNHVLDGQHRTEAFIKDNNEHCKRIDVQYVNIDPEDEIDMTISCNIKTKTWNMNDFIISYAKRIEDYQKLYNWCNCHPLFKNECSKKKNGYNLRYRSAVYCIKGSDCNAQKMLKEGKLTLTDEELENAEVVYNELDQIMKVFEIPLISAPLEAFIKGWCSARENYSFSFQSWLEAFKTKKTELQKIKFSGKKDTDIAFNLVIAEIVRKK